MKKLWAAVLTGLLGCTGVSWAADPVTPNTAISPYTTVPPAVTVDATTPKKTTDTVSQTDAKKPAIAKAAESKLPASVLEGKPATPETPVVTTSCGTVGCCTATTSCKTKCAICEYKPIIPRHVLGCGWCGGCLTGAGKLGDWLTYCPVHLTPPGQCGAEPRMPPTYAFFLDVPCRENWKPTCCDCGKTNGGCAAGAGGSCAAVSAPVVSKPAACDSSTAACPPAKPILTFPVINQWLHGD